MVEFLSKKRKPKSLLNNKALKKPLTIQESKLSLDSKKELKFPVKKKELKLSTDKKEPRTSVKKKESKFSSNDKNLKQSLKIEKQNSDFEKLKPKLPLKTKDLKSYVKKNDSKQPVLKEENLKSFVNTKYFKRSAFQNEKSKSFVNNKKFISKKKVGITNLAKDFEEIVRYKPYGLRSVNLLTEKQSFSHKIHILITSNNVFCNLTDNIRKKTLSVCNSGKYKIKISKKRVHVNFEFVLSKFLQEAKNKIGAKFSFSGLIFTIVSATRMRKKILSLITDTFINSRLLIKILHKKIFNGCRPKKKVRKKRSGLRIFK